MWEILFAHNTIAVTVVSENNPVFFSWKYSIFYRTRILSEVSSKTSSTLQGGTLIILGRIFVLFLKGDNQSGKSSLLARLEKNESQGQRSALEYHFLNVQNDFRDGSYAYQLGTAGALGPAENLSLPVSVFSYPSVFINRFYVCLVKFDSFCEEERFWQEYVEPVESSMTSSMAPGALEDAGLLPLEQGVLTENCGATFVVVITKNLIKLGNEMTDHQADRILVQVRRLCLQLGAALIYTSAKNVKNIQVSFYLIGVVHIM
ncbi:unnamed protein product, partial [Nippostrongylus brasiliensis]